MEISRVTRPSLNSSKLDWRRKCVYGKEEAKTDKGGEFEGRLEQERPGVDSRGTRWAKAKKRPKVLIGGAVTDSTETQDGFSEEQPTVSKLEEPSYSTGLSQKCM
ncbi:hypothetical protein KM043_010637 [Ampulex compressa]|nr:hypothetical protein KM043_010637 [Ampulex compressa]